MKNASFADGLFNRLNPIAGYKNIWAIGARYNWSIPIVAIGGLVTSLLEGVGISLLIPLLGVLMPSGGGDGAVTEHTEVSFLSDYLEKFRNLIPAEYQLPVIAITILLFVIVKGVISSLLSVFIGWIDGRAGHDVRTQMTKRLTEVGYPFYLKNDPAELLTILSSQSWSATDAIRTVSQMVSDAAAIIVFTVLLMSIDWRLTLLVGVCSVAISACQNSLREKARELGEKVSEANHELGERMLVVVEAFRMIKIFGQEKREHARFSAVSERVRKTSFEAELFGARVGPVLESVHASLFIAVVLVAYFAKIPGPVLLAFLVLLYRLQPFIQSIDSARLALAEAETPLDEVEWLLDPTDKPPPPMGETPFTGLDGPVRFEGVTFRYPTRPDAPAALADVTLTFQPGCATALVGRSGSGKTTMVNLLCQLLQPTHGRIMIGSSDLSDIEANSWRGALGFAGQDVELVDGTIGENIAYGYPEATREEIREAARLADIGAFIESLPEGYDTDVGNRGLSLSGGQRQRVGLARALVRRPEIMIFDEATNAIDGFSEAAIMNVVRERRTTAIVVSHRASTLSYCDQGIVIEDGHVLETGPLNSLESYKRMAGLMPS